LLHPPRASTRNEQRHGSSQCNEITRCGSSPHYLRARLQSPSQPAIHSWTIQAGPCGQGGSRTATGRSHALADLHLAFCVRERMRQLSNLAQSGRACASFTGGGSSSSAEPVAAATVLEAALEAALGGGVGDGVGDGVGGNLGRLACGVGRRCWERRQLAIALMLNGWRSG
jgi:hypothetical protein